MGRCRPDTREPANSEAGAEIRRERAVEASEQSHCAPLPASVSHHERTHLNKIVLSILDHGFSPPLLEASQNHSLIHRLQSLLSPFSLSAYPPLRLSFIEVLFLNKCLMIAKYKLKYIFKKQLVQRAHSVMKT